MRLRAAESVRSRCKCSTRWSQAAPVSIDFQSGDRIKQRPTCFLSSKANECTWRPRRHQVDPCYRRRHVARGVLRSSCKPNKTGNAELPAASYVLPTRINVNILRTERDGVFFYVFFLHTLWQMLRIGCVPDAFHVSPAGLWILWPEGVSGPLTTAPRS